MSARDTRQPLVTAPAPARRSGWRVVSVLLTLLALAAVAGLGKLAYEQAQQLRSAQQRLDGLDARLQGLASDQSEQAQTGQTQLAMLHDLQGSVNHLNTTLGGDQRRQWQLEEVNYYVRMAQQHLLLTHDVEGSRGLIDAAARILADTTDADLMDLRQALSNDQLALKLAVHVDVAGTYLRLNSLDQQLAGLTLPMEAGGHRQEGVVEAPDAPAPAASSGFQGRAAVLMNQGWAKFRSLIVVRHYDEPIKPLLSDAQRALITENLRLHLGQAQLALLRGDQGIYSASLQTAAADFGRYFQLLPAAQYQGIQSELAALAQVPVQPSVPAITSVAELDKLQSRSAPAPAASSGVVP